MLAWGSGASGPAQDAHVYLGYLDSKENAAWQWFGITHGAVIIGDYPDKNAEYYTQTFTTGENDGKKIGDVLSDIEQISHDWGWSTSDEDLVDGGNVYQFAIFVLQKMGALHEWDKTQADRAQQKCRTRSKLQSYLMGGVFQQVAPEIRKEVTSGNPKPEQLRTEIDKSLSCWKQLVEYWDCECDLRKPIKT